MNTLDDADVRYWKRINAALAVGVTAVLVTTFAFMAGTRQEPHLLAVSCEAQGTPESVFDDSGTYAAICAGRAVFSDGRLRIQEKATYLPPISPDAPSEPNPPTF